MVESTGNKTTIDFFGFDLLQKLEDEWFVGLCGGATEILVNGKTVETIYLEGPAIDESNQRPQNGWDERGAITGAELGTDNDDENEGERGDERGKENPLHSEGFDLGVELRDLRIDPVHHVANDKKHQSPRSEIRQIRTARRCKQIATTTAGGRSQKVQAI